MNLSDPTQMEAPGNKVASAKKLYRCPAFKKLGLADALRLLASDSFGHDPAPVNRLENLDLSSNSGGA